MPTIATLQAAKFWVALAGSIVTAILGSWDGAPLWLTVLAAVLTAAGVFLTPNASPPTDEPLGDHAAPPDAP